MVNTNCSYAKSPNYASGFSTFSKTNTTGMNINFLDYTAYYSLTYWIQCSVVWSYIDRYVEWFLFTFVQMYTALRNCRQELTVNIIPVAFCWEGAQYIRAGWGFFWIIVFTTLGTAIVFGAVFVKWIIEISGLYALIRDWVRDFNKENGTKLTIPGYV